MDKAPEISVIVPIYNVEKYLGRCLDSILASTFEDIEVILVDDCGQDNSRAICDEYAAKDNRIQIVENPHNMGVSAARNNGMNHAHGKYISFVDSDDYIDRTMFEKLYKAMERENVDMVGCNVWSVETDGNKEIIKYLDVSKDVKTSFTKLGNKIYQSHFHVVRFLYKSDLLQKIRFPEKISFAEDVIFLLQVYPLLQDIYFLAEPLYFYCHHQNTLSSICHERNFQTLKMKDVVMEAFSQNPRADIIREGFWDWYTANLAGVYKLVPPEMQASFVKEAEKNLPYANYSFFLNHIHKSYEKYYLFDWLPIITVSQKFGKKHVKLFGKIPLYKVKSEWR
ncbi:MAG: glycosyltransferase family 2 protein [Alphaproteobacteria bacterium]|nr:glycosyltransferase family 2 protein [Alphaproteobacteria bacterium]